MQRFSVAGIFIALLLSNAIAVLRTRSWRGRTALLFGTPTKEKSEESRYCTFVSWQAKGHNDH